MRHADVKAHVVREDPNSIVAADQEWSLASPEEAILDYLRFHEMITNSKAREITEINADQRVRTIFRRMVAKKMIERVPGSKTRSTAYRLRLAAGNPTVGKILVRLAIQRSIEPQEPAAAASATDKRPLRVLAKLSR
jgi:hypothetical protein